MHERTRRTICRMLFLLMCVLPTLITISAVAFVRTDWYHDLLVSRWNQELGQLLELTATVRSAAQPSYRLSILRDIELRDRETGRIAGRLSRLEVSHRGPIVSIVAHDAELQANYMSSIGDAAQRRLLRSLPASSTETRLLIKQLNIQDGEQTTDRFTDVLISVARQPQQSQIGAAFRLADRQTEHPITLSIVRQHQNQPPTTECELRSNGNVLRCTTAANLFPVLARLGAESTFNGIATVVQQDRHWRGQMAGSLRQIDLQQFSSPYRHQVSGLADSDLNVQFADGVVTLAKGTATVQEGEIDTALLELAQHHLGVQLSHRILGESSPRVAFQQLGFGFNADKNRLAISGATSGRYPGVICFDRFGPIASQHTPREMPLPPRLAGRTDILTQIFSDSSLY